jgi:RHS repeat-associated protein
LGTLKSNGSSKTFQYNADGTMKTDGLRTLALTYNYLKLPRTVNRGTTSTVTYIYDATGNKLAVSQDGTAKNYYCGDFVYDGSLAVSYILTPNGQLTRNPSTGAYTSQYNITDHLGNVRSVVSSSGTVLQSTDYYPFGLAFSDSYIASNRYLYNGKELEDYTLGTTYLGTLDYGARHYDPRIARWTVPDPMAEKYYGVNAYGYCKNAPNDYIDPNGQNLIGWLLAYKAIAAGMEHFGRTSKVKTAGFIMQRPISAVLIGLPNDEKNNISSVASHYSINITKHAEMKEDLDIGSPANAMRHTIWQAIITRDLGENVAVRVGNAHEGIVNRSDLIADTDVDQKNNIIGRTIGLSSKKSSNTEIVRKVIEYYKEYGLWVFSLQSDGTYKQEQIKMTEDQYKLAIDELQKLNGYGKRK